METSDITATDLHDETLGPNIFDELRKEVSKRIKRDKNMHTLADYTSSIFQGFECYLRTENDLVEDDIRLIVDEYCSSFIACKILSSVFFFIYLSNFFEETSI